MSGSRCRVTDCCNGFPYYIKEALAFGEFLPLLCSKNTLNCDFV